MTPPSTRGALETSCCIRRELARARPAGRARVTITLEDDDGGTRVHMEEHAVTGPGAYLPRLLHDPFINVRNSRALRRLSRLVRAAGE